MEQKFAGFGLAQIMVLWLVLGLMTIGAKIIVNKYQPQGLTELVNTL